MLLAHELVRNAAMDGGVPVPDVVVDLSDVEEAVRSSRKVTCFAPGERLPRPAGSHMPWESAVYEHPLESEYVRRRNIYASQERSEEGLYRLTMSVIDMGLVGDELDIAYYGACRVLLDEHGIMSGFERDRSGDPHEVLVDDGELLEMVFPVLVANHLVNAGVLRTDDDDDGQGHEVTPSAHLVTTSPQGSVLRA